MADIVTGSANLKYDRLSLVPLGGQSEQGQVLWLLCHAGEIVLVDAGAAYPGEDLPGVDLLLPNTNFLEAHQDKIAALILTNGHEEHSGAVGYLLNHVKIPRIMAPRFVSSLVSQNLTGRFPDTIIDTIETRHPYEIGPFQVEWVRVNDAIADACALKISTPEGVVVYTSSFKLDRTPVDDRLADLSYLSQTGDAGVLLLLSDSAGVENSGYTPSEKFVIPSLERRIIQAAGRVIVVMPGTNTHRLQILFDIAGRVGRSVVLYGETLLQTALVSALTGNLLYDRRLESCLGDMDRLEDRSVLVVATGCEGDPFAVLSDLAGGRSEGLIVRPGDTIIYSADTPPGSLRQMAVVLDQLLSVGVSVAGGARAGVHVSKHASREELKLMLSVIKPKFFVPALGEGRHIMHHAQLAVEWGIDSQNVFPLRNGEILEVANGLASVSGSIEAQAVLFNRDQGERVTSYSVNERRSLSLEGVLTIAVTVDEGLSIVSGPEVEAGAAGFLRSAEWEKVRAELVDALGEVARLAAGNSNSDLNALRAAMRETAARMVRQRLQAKPLIHVVVQLVG